jgi:hypothetical protein
MNDQYKLEKYQCKSLDKSKNIYLKKIKFYSEKIMDGGEHDTIIYFVCEKCGNKYFDLPITQYKCPNPNCKGNLKIMQYLSNRYNLKMYLTEYRKIEKYKNFLITLFEQFVQEVYRNSSLMIEKINYLMSELKNLDGIYRNFAGVFGSAANRINESNDKRSKIINELKILREILFSNEKRSIAQKRLDVEKKNQEEINLESEKLQMIINEKMKELENINGADYRAAERSLEELQQDLDSIDKILLRLKKYEEDEKSKEKKIADEQVQKLLEEKRIAEEKVQRLLEKNRITDEQRLEEKRIADEQKMIADEQRREEKMFAHEQRIKEKEIEEDQVQRLLEENRIAEEQVQRLLEEKRIAEDQKKTNVLVAQIEKKHKKEEHKNMQQYNR